MRRACLSLLVAAIAVLALRADACAQNYPDRAVSIIIAFAAGGTIGTLGRIVAQKLSETWGQSVFVENRPGASGKYRRAGRRAIAARRL
jgi:tripartite-type tricarboxylate transporter receptor subunit TctC